MFHPTALLPLALVSPARHRTRQNSPSVSSYSRPYAVGAIAPGSVAVVVASAPAPLVVSVIYLCTLLYAVAGVATSDLASLRDQVPVAAATALSYHEHLRPLVYSPSLPPTYCP